MDRGLHCKKVKLVLPLIGGPNSRDLIKGGYLISQGMKHSFIICVFLIHIGFLYVHLHCAL